LKAASAIDYAVRRICEIILLITGSILMVTLTANVIARYVLSAGGFDWSEEIPEQLFPWFIMAGVALAVQHLGHVAVEWLHDIIRPSRLRAVLLAGHGLVLATYGLAVVQALIVADIVSIERSPVLGLPKTYGYWSIAVGGAMIALSTFAGMIRLVVIGPKGNALPPKPEPTS
jgi:TRAP-type C4-dicarboxylate transport system permease small subunit